jgi:YD repeat-containing protein
MSIANGIRRSSFLTVESDRLGLIVTVDGPFGVLQTYVYDAASNRTLTTDSLGGQPLAAEFVCAGFWGLAHCRKGLE